MTACLSLRNLSGIYDNHLHDLLMSKSDRNTVWFILLWLVWFIEQCLLRFELVFVSQFNIISQLLQFGQLWFVYHVDCKRDNFFFIIQLIYDKQLTDRQIYYIPASAVLTNLLCYHLQKLASRQFKNFYYLFQTRENSKKFLLQYLPPQQTFRSFLSLSVITLLD